MKAARMLLVAAVLLAFAATLVLVAGCPSSTPQEEGGAGMGAPKSMKPKAPMNEMAPAANAMTEKAPAMEKAPAGNAMGEKMPEKMPEKAANAMAPAKGKPAPTKP